MSEATYKAPEQWAQDAVEAMLYEDERETRQAQEWRETIQFVVNQAIKAEREACAQICDQWMDQAESVAMETPDPRRQRTAQALVGCGESIAKYIRARSSAPDAVAPSESGPVAREGE